MKRILKLLFTAVPVISILFMAFTFYIKPQNAFDQMYDTRVRNTYNWWGWNRKSMFGNMKQLEKVSRDSEAAFTREGEFKNVYKEEYLEENQRLSIGVYKDDKKVTFSFFESFPSSSEVLYEDTLCYTYSYSVDTKTLMKCNIELRNNAAGYLTLYEINSLYNVY